MNEKTSKNNTFTNIEFNPMKVETLSIRTKIGHFISNYVKEIYNLDLTTEKINELDRTQIALKSIKDEFKYKEQWTYIYNDESLYQEIIYLVDRMIFSQYLTLYRKKKFGLTTKANKLIDIAKKTLPSLKYKYDINNDKNLWGNENTILYNQQTTYYCKNTRKN